MEHLLDHHAEEMKNRRTAIKEALDAKAHKKWDRDAPTKDSLGYRIPDKRDVDTRDDRSIVQQMVVDFMEAYHNRVGVPQLIGRKRWYTTANLARVVVSFRLPRVDYTKKGWEPPHVSWLETCKTDYAKFITSFMESSALPPKLTTGYSQVVQRAPPADTAKSNKRPITGKAATHPRGKGVMGPPKQVPPPRSPMMEMLQAKFKVKQPVDLMPAAAAAPTVAPTAAEVATIVSSISASLEKSTGSRGKQPAAASTVTSSSTYPGKETSSSSTKERGSPEPKTPAKATQLKKQVAGTTKRARDNSTSPAVPRKSAKMGTGALLDDLRSREKEWQTRAATAEDQLSTLRGKYRKLEQDHKEARTA